MKEEFLRLKTRMTAAEEILAAERPSEPIDPTPEELAAGVDFIFRRHEASYLLEARNEPARIAGWLMARLIGERAIYMQDAEGMAPILGTVDAEQVQKVQRIVADRKTVALVDLAMERQIGNLMSSPAIVAMLREAGLPVWEHLLID